MSNFPAPETRTLVREYIARELRQYLQAERIISGAGILVKQTVAGKTLSVAPSASQPFTHPLQVYLEGGYICVRAGHHIWFNEVSNAHDREDLEKTSLDAWQAYTSGARTVFVKRIYNSDGSATVTLENTADSYITTLGQINNTTAIWILATISDSVITQWWTGGDIYELRVA